MADKTQTKTQYLREKAVQPKTKEMENLLGSGYGGMTVEKAKTIIKERGENPLLWPYEMYEKAKAFLEAYEAKPQVIDTQPGWKRKQVAE